MKTLLGTLLILWQSSAEVDAGLRKRARKVFRREYERAFQEQKVVYLSRVIEGQFITSAAMAEFLGYKSRSAVDAIKKGSISLEKLHLLMETLGGQVPWPAAEQRTTPAMMAAVRFVRSEDGGPTIRMPLDRARFEYLCMALSDEDRGLWELATDGEDEAWIDALTRWVRVVLPGCDRPEAETMRQLLVEWGPAFLKARQALYGFVR